MSKQVKGNGSEASGFNPHIWPRPDQAEESVASGVYHYKGFTIAKSGSKKWVVSQATAGFHAEASKLEEAKSLVDKSIKDFNKRLKELRESKPKRGNVPAEVVHAIRNETEEYFKPGGPRGKVKKYKELADKYNLGVETVARIARGDSHSDI